MSKMASINTSLHSCPWKNHQYFNWNGWFICPKKAFAWLKLALWSLIAYLTAMNLWHFRRQSTLNVSQTWLQWNTFCAHVRGNIKYILTEMGYLYAQKYFAWLKSTLWSRIGYFTAMNFWPFQLQSTLNAGQTQFQSNKYCAHVRGKIDDFFTPMGYDILTFTCPKIYFAWLKLALLNRKSPNTALKFWPSRRQSALDASQTWLQSTDNCAHIRTKIFNVLTEMDISYVQKYILFN